MKFGTADTSNKNHFFISNVELWVQVVPRYFGTYEKRSTQVI